MTKDDFISCLSSRTTCNNAEHIAEALGEHLIFQLHHLREGAHTSAFEIEGSNLVFKVSDRKRLNYQSKVSSRFAPYQYHRQVIHDDSYTFMPEKEGEAEIVIEPKLSHKGVTRLHQEMLRYKLWTEEGMEFWDILPARSCPEEIKNVLLDHRGVPYQVDSGAVTLFDDRYNDYPPNGDGKRTDAQYLRYRADCFDEHGRPDAISKEKLFQITEACRGCHWPVESKSVFDPYVDQPTLKTFKKALSSLELQTTYASR